MADAARHYRIDALGECALLVSLGEGTGESTNRRVHGLARIAREANIKGLLELVPAYASLLFVFEPEVCSVESLREQIRSLLERPGQYLDAEPRTVEIPVSYGGAWGRDIEAVATLHGRSWQEVVDLHTAPLYRVRFLGFMPGFAYLDGLNPHLATPRHTTPRVRVPAGSVGIAGNQTGVYPLDSPGGWQIIGRTGLKMWDVVREPPALLAPGHTVKFVASGDDIAEFPPNRAFPHPSLTTGWPTMEVLHAGALTTVQDLGRRGYGHVGLSGGGAMDPDAMALANWLVGNEPVAGALELTWSGPTLRALSTVVIALTGADMGCEVGGNPVPSGVSWLVRAGSLIRFRHDSALTHRLRAYLAVGGGIDVPLVLGSRSTYMPAGFGGYVGRPLHAGDILSTCQMSRSPVEFAGRILREEHVQPLGDCAVLRVVRYEGKGAATRQAVQELMEAEFVVNRSSDRMGIRLEPVGGNYIMAPREEVISFGVVRGTIQLPAGGAPLVLGADHQTTGGYPVAGVVPRVDWPVMAALLPGQRVRLREIGVDDARRAYVESRRRLAHLL